MTPITPAQTHLLSSLEGFAVRWDPAHEPPEWAYMTNSLGERVWVYAHYEMWLTSQDAQDRAEGQP